MPHPATFAVAASLGAAAAVGTAVAFELTVFRPWRRENWPDGIAAGVRREWQEMQEGLRGGLWEMRDRHSHGSGSGGGGDEGEGRALQAEMDDFEMHERHLADVRAQMADDSGPGQQVRARHPWSAADEAFPAALVDIGGDAPETGTAGSEPFSASLRSITTARSSDTPALAPPENEQSIYVDTSADPFSSGSDGDGIGEGSGSAGRAGISPTVLSRAPTSPRSDDFTDVHDTASVGASSDGVWTRIDDSDMESDDDDIGGDFKTDTTAPRAGQHPL